MLGLRAWVLAILVAGVVPIPVQSRTVRFSGGLKKGQQMCRDISNSLRFCLVALPDTGQNSGWGIRIDPSPHPVTPDYASIATPPYHGPNPTSIVAWFFNDGANAPHERHDFQFVLNAADYDRLRKAVGRGHIVRDKLQLGRGTLMVTSLTIDPTDGSIGSIRFTVRLDWR
jgi:hypothetical protein